VQLTKESWQSYFAFLTYFQFLGRDLFAFSMKAKDDPFWMNLSTVRSETSIGGGSAWDDAFALSDGDAFCTASLKAMRAEGLPPPKMFEDVFNAEGMVFSSPWMQWPDKKLMALPLEDLADVELKEQWRAISIDVESSPEKFVKNLKELYNG
jgi:hypothetical protein